MRGYIARSERLFGGHRQGPERRNRRLEDRRRSLHPAACLPVAVAALVAATAGTQDAAANGETRTLTFYHTHTQESTTVTFRRNGEYDEQALTQLNWFLRDWRVDRPTKMDPRLFDIIWEVYRESGSTKPINIISAYRSPETNSALRRRSSGVSEHSQHMLGKAMDIRLPDVDTGRLRAIAMKMQYGGVGYYQSSAFVHVDTGNVRAWPRMTQEQLARLFPDGKTLHLPSNGKPLQGYEQAKAEILARNAALAAQASAGGGPSVGGLLANLFGRKTPPQAPPAETTSTPATTLAYASVDGMVSVQTMAAPLPPQRPQALATSAESATRPETASDDEITTASLPARSIALGPVATLGLDEKAAVRALFDPRTSFLDTGFTTQPRDELSTTRFTGPAVKPVPVLKQAQAQVASGG